MYTHVRIYLCICTCARTHQAFESQLQDEDANFTDDESEACEGGAMQDQRGNETCTGKVACLMCCDTLVLPLGTSHVTLVNVGPQLLCHPDQCIMSRLWMRILSFQVTRNRPVLTQECPKEAREQGRVAQNWTMKDCQLNLMWCKSACIVMCTCVSIWSYAMKIGSVDNHHFCNGTIQTGELVLGADTKCLHESLHTCYSKWLEDYIQTMLDNLPLGMKMHRWCSCVCVLHVWATLWEDGMLVTDQYWPLVWMQRHLKRRR